MLLPTHSCISLRRRSVSDSWVNAYDYDLKSFFSFQPVPTPVIETEEESKRRLGKWSFYSARSL